LKTAAGQRSAELLAEFEQQLASIYSYDQDEIWKQATEAAGKAVAKAKAQIAARCKELGIPARFAPTVEWGWRGRGENAVAERCGELRAVAKTRIAVIETAAFVKIEMSCLDAQTQVIANGLSSEAARSFFEAMPNVEALMPPLEFPAIEAMLQSRLANRKHSISHALRH
jgi:hypothetical protein